MNRTVSGFTLVEVILAVGVVTAVSGVMMAQFRTYNQRQAANVAADRLKQVFTEARTNAMSGKMDCAVCGGADQTCNEVDDASLVGWRVIINTGGVDNGYVIQGMCATSTNTYTYMTRMEQFPSNVTVSLQFSSPSSVTFKPLNGGTDLPQSLYMQAEGRSGSAEQFMVTAAGEVVPWAPTPIPAPTCSGNGGKCVNSGQLCFPWTIVAGACAPGEKCVPAIAWCGSYTCWLPGQYICFPSSCFSPGYPYPIGGYTCPPAWICCHI